MLRKIWRVGIPAEVRSKVWRRTVPNNLKITSEMYAAVNQQAKGIREKLEREKEGALRQSNIHLIEVDVPRTFANLGIFLPGGPLHLPLKTILEAFNAFRPDVGYVQGMSHLGAMLLLYLDTETAFISLANILDRPFFVTLFRMELKELLRYFQV